MSRPPGTESTFTGTFTVLNVGKTGRRQAYCGYPYYGTPRSWRIGGGRPDAVAIEEAHHLCSEQYVQRSVYACLLYIDIVCEAFSR